MKRALAVSYLRHCMTASGQSQANTLGRPFLKQNYTAASCVRTRSDTRAVFEDGASSALLRVTHGLFEQRMDGHGLNLHEMAVLASALEHLVHDEAKGLLA